MTNDAVDGGDDDFPYETTVLEITSPTGDEIEDFVIIDCGECGNDIPRHSPAFIWGEPYGDDPIKPTHVAVTVSCSRQCVDDRIAHFANFIERDVLVVWRIR